MRTRDEAWVALDRGHKTFMDCLGQLTEEELTSRPVVGDWTVKDVVAHVWSWLDEAVRTVKAWDASRTWQEGVAYDDAWNEKAAKDKSALALIPVVDSLTGAHRRLMHQLDMAEEDSLRVVAKTPRGEEMALVDYFYSVSEHYHDHVADLKTYQEQCLECD